MTSNVGSLTPNLLHPYMGKKSGPLGPLLEVSTKNDPNPTRPNQKKGWFWPKWGQKRPLMTSNMGSLTPNLVHPYMGKKSGPLGPLLEVFVKNDPNPTRPNQKKGWFWPKWGQKRPLMTSNVGFLTPNLVHLHMGKKSGPLGPLLEVFVKNDPKQQAKPEKGWFWPKWGQKRPLMTLNMGFLTPNLVHLYMGKKSGPLGPLLVVSTKNDPNPTEKG